MSSTRSKLRLVGAFAAMATLALALSCTGFFVNPTLTGVSVGPQSLTLNINQTWQMGATGTYSDGTQKALTSGVAWLSSDNSTVSVGQSSGIVTGLQTGSATITASAGSCSACSGSTTVSVVLTGVTSITVSPSSQSVSIAGSAVFSPRPPCRVETSPKGLHGISWTPQTPTRTRTSPHFVFRSRAAAKDSCRRVSCAGTYTINVTYPGTTAVGTAKLTVTN